GSRPRKWYPRAGPRPSRPRRSGCVGSARHRESGGSRPRRAAPPPPAASARAAAGRRRWRTAAWSSRGLLPKLEDECVATFRESLLEADRILVGVDQPPMRGIQRGELLQGAGPEDLQRFGWLQPAPVAADRHEEIDV